MYSMKVNCKGGDFTRKYQSHSCYDYALIWVFRLAKVEYLAQHLLFFLIIFKILIEMYIQINGCREETVRRYVEYYFFYIK